MTSISNEAWGGDLLAADPVLPESRPRSIAETHDQEYVENRWREIIRLLNGWREDTSGLVAEEIDPPSRELTDQALRTVAWMRAQGRFPPDRVLPCPDGGIAFEWYQEPWDFDLELSADGTVTWAKYFQARTVERHRSTWKT